MVCYDGRSRDIKSHIDVSRYVFYKTSRYNFCFIKPILNESVDKFIFIFKKNQI